MLLWPFCENIAYRSPLLTAPTMAVVFVMKIKLIVIPRRVSVQDTSLPPERESHHLDDIEAQTFEMKCIYIESTRQWIVMLDTLKNQSSFSPSRGRIGLIPYPFLIRTLANLTWSPPYPLEEFV